MTKIQLNNPRFSLTSSPTNKIIHFYHFNYKEKKRLHLIEKIETKNSYKNLLLFNIKIT